VSNFIHNEVDMTPEASKEYQCAVEEAANAFMKVMALRGFSVRDYPQNFVAQMAQQTRLAFETNRVGAHPGADTLVSDFAPSCTTRTQIGAVVQGQSAAISFFAPPHGLSG